MKRWDSEIPRREAISKIVAAAGLFAFSPRILRADTFLSIDETKEAYFPGETFTLETIVLSREQKATIQKASKVRVRSLEVQTWKSDSGGVLFIDNVIGKHEFIDYALALNPDGSVRGVEVLSFRESYGDEIKNPKWRAQFHGKVVADYPKVDKNIKNISGATLSCVHITDGVRRLLHTWDLVGK